MSAALTPLAQRPIDEPAPKVNVAELIREAARRWPDKKAVLLPGPRDRGGRRSYSHQSFAELDRAVDRYASGLGALGVRPGARVLMMVTPGIEFFGLSFALFRLGAVPVMIDPGMGRRSVLGAIREVEPEVMIGVPKAHLARRLFPGAFKSVRIAVSVGSSFPFGGVPLAAVEGMGKDHFPAAPTRAADTAAILFTSGSTGAPKGVLYDHGIFVEQTRIFREELHIEAGEVDLSAFPLFSLFSAALGVSCVVPDMDVSRPAQVRAERITEAVHDQGVTYCFGSPAFWARVVEHCEARQIQLPTVRRVLMAGAPAPVSLLERLMRIIPKDADVYTPYGATESLPITMPSAREILAGPAARTRQGAGTFVGRPLGRTQVKILKISEEPIAELGQAQELPPGEIGEITVTGPVTTQAYFRRPGDDERSKILDPDPSARKWHRMGDVGWLDAQGQLWFCGRKAHRVESAHGPMYTEKCEAIYNRHPRVLRSALVGVGARGQQRPVIIVECRPGSAPRGRVAEEELRQELLALGAESELTRSIHDVLFHPRFPVDPRHNAKIIREALAVWAEAKVEI